MPRDFQSARHCACQCTGTAAACSTELLRYVLQRLNSAVYCIVAIWGQVRNRGCARGVPVCEALCRPVYRYGSSLQH